MKRFTILLTILVWFSQSNLQAQGIPDAYILGQCQRADLTKAPYASWYEQQYQAYIPNQYIIEQLKLTAIEDYRIRIFFGSWCGDSKREVPRFLKILDQLNFPEDKLELIGLDRGEHHKQSPQGEEKGLGIYRVPTIILMKEGNEYGRINEFPVISLERDLLQLLQAKEYTPNYASYSYLLQWETEGVLNDRNTDIRGLANQLRSKISGPAELNAAGYVFLRRQEYFPAALLFRLNLLLHPDFAHGYDSLGEAFEAAGETANAIWAYETAFKMDPKLEHLPAHIEKLKVFTKAE